MEKATNKIATLIANTAERVAKKSVGRSIPLCMYEPRVPETLKKTIKKD